MSQYSDRIRLQSLTDKITTAAEAAKLVKNGMTVGMSGFTRAGEAKALPIALAERARHEELKITLITGASLGNDMDKLMAESGLLARRMPFQSDAGLRKAINSGEVMFIDQHLSDTAEQLRAGSLPKVNVAIIEACAITENGGIVPTTSVGNSASFAEADVVIVELNLAHPAALEGLHDIYLPPKRPGRTPIPLINGQDRIGTTYIPVDPARIAAIVITDQEDSYSAVLPSDDETQAIANHLIAFFEQEVERGNLTESLLPLQAGVGTIANAVMSGLLKSNFSGMTMYSEVLQDSTFELFDAGKLAAASGCSFTLSERMCHHVMANLDTYKDKLVLRPQEISNHPEIVRRIGIIGINTALEFDIYGNVNSTHVNGTHMMNGLGGSGDFTRNAHLAIFVTKSVAKGGAISSVVPMTPHVDHNEHDVDILVTEQGLADLRGLAPRERAQVIINHCVHPDFRPAMQDYFDRACATVGGQTPHILSEAFSWHTNMQQTGHMLGKK
ncbi:succinyl-CoA:acetate CoA-transferase [Pseudomonas linyingensis]|jgi:succinyl-CoA:acetate CoA-transferase|uniref:Succinyl-CoA:acetate CoA-transferase n=1 Tax=Pseudomonas linyingensis TaxID=915471 RepID=A0A1H7AML8_9PSED|nr:succinate CoA transferase [Pseudomonas linyingensis]MCM2320496.1 succinate CoA transferase [Pseudomonas sp.]SEJ63322.1 succinyl-CoA:acetate CoA-transferase [Pseudomonas linyingensis]